MPPYSLRPVVPTVARGDADVADQPLPTTTITMP
jgi:hypothetical protein